MESTEKGPMTQLECDTAAYYKNMSEDELRAERELENAIAGAAAGIDVDTEGQRINWIETSLSSRVRLQNPSFRNPTQLSCASPTCAIALGSTCPAVDSRLA